MMLLVALIPLTILLNITYYEYRVWKGSDTPKTFDFTGWKGQL